MVDPTSDVGDVKADDAPACTECGAPVTGDSHRVRSRIVDGESEHVHFCDDDCLDAFEPRE